MAQPAGILNTTKIRLELELVRGSGAFTPLPAETSHSWNLTFEGIDITNKSDPDIRNYLESEGKKLIDASIEALENSSPEYQLLFTSLINGTFVRMRRVTANILQECDFMLKSLGSNGGMTEAANGSFAMESTGPITTAMVEAA